jgi:hypothetical protein
MLMKLTPGRYVRKTLGKILKSKLHVDGNLVPPAPLPTRSRGRVEKSVQKQCDVDEFFILEKSLFVGLH